MGLRNNVSRCHRIDNELFEIRINLSGGDIDHLDPRVLATRRGTGAPVGQIPCDIVGSGLIRSGQAQSFDHQIGVITKPHIEGVQGGGRIVPFLEILIHGIA